MENGSDPGVAIAAKANTPNISPRRHSFNLS